MKLDRFVMAAAKSVILVAFGVSSVAPVLAAPFGTEGARALGQVRLAQVRNRNGEAVAVGAVAGAAVVLGALAVSRANADETYYAPAPPPPPPPATIVEEHVVGPPDESADEALRACQSGILDAARRYGAFDARVGFIDSVRETDDGGHRVRAEITVYYPDFVRTSNVSCRTRDGYLLSARSDT